MDLFDSGYYDAKVFRTAPLYQIQQHDVWLLLIDQFQRRSSLPRAYYIESIVSQVVDHKIQDVVFIINN